MKMPVMRVFKDLYGKSATVGSRVTSCPGLPGTVPEWEKMSRVPAMFIPGQ